MLKSLYRSAFATLMAAACSVGTMLALPVSYYTSNSLLSTGKWVKVKVTKTGMQEISFDQLREMGFSDPEKVAVYGYSGVDIRSYNFSKDLPDDLPAVPVANYGDKLVFYGVANEVGVDHNSPSSSHPNDYRPELLRNKVNLYTIYFLTDSQERQTVTVSNEAPSTTLTALDNARGLEWYNYTKTQPSSVGAYLFGDDFSSADDKATTVSVYLPEYDPDNGMATFLYGVGEHAKSGYIAVSAPGSTTSRVAVEGYGNDATHLAYNYSTGTAYLNGMTKTDNDIYDIKISAAASTDPVSFAALDYYVVSYPRTTKITDRAQEVMEFPVVVQGQPIKLTSAGSVDALKVWEVPTTVGGATAELTVGEIDADGNYGFVADRAVKMTTGAAGMHVVVFDPSKELYQPELVGEIANQNLHAMATPEMLIVASPNCYDAALQLAELHRKYTGCDAAVVNFKDVCNEFTSGLPHHMAARRMAKMFYDRDPEKFKALLLFGRAFHDNTGATDTGNEESFLNTYIPMLENEETRSCGATPTSYATDATYAMLNDNFVFDHVMSEFHMLKAPLDIKIGRVPASSAGEAIGYVNKVEKYLSELTDKPIYNKAIITADPYDGNLHLEQAMQLHSMIGELSPSTMVDQHYISLYNPYGRSNEQMRTRLGQLLKRGESLWVFIGHSTSASYIGANSLWSVAYDRSVEVDNPPFTIFGTCQSQELDFPTPSLQVEMLLNTTGGMIGGIGPTRPVYAQYNFFLVNMMTRSFYTQKAGATMGDVYRDGRQIYVDNPSLIGANGSNSSVAINNMSYNLGGDPMLPLYIPENSVKVTAVDSATPSESLNFDPLTKHTIEGNIYTSEGEVDTTFNGTMTMMVYDGDHVEDSSLLADDNNETVEVTLDETLLQEVKFAVKDGHFSGDIMFATPAYYGTGNRVTMYAVTDDLTRRASGWLDGVLISQNLPEEGSEITTAPEITSMYADDPSLAESAAVPANFTLYATVNPGEVGLIGTSDRFGGGGVVLMLDDSKKLSGVDGYFEVDTDGTATLSYPVTELSDGYHTLRLRVVNVAGNSTERTLTVNVISVASAETVVEQESPRSDVVIDVKHQLSDPATGRLVITNPMGKAVFTTEVSSFPYTWNMTDTSASPVANGVYSAAVYFNSGRHYGYATPAQIIVAR